MVNSKNIYAFFQLIRWPNLLIMISTQVAIRYGLIEVSLRKMFPLGEVLLVLSSVHFLLFVISTVCIASAGYIINDYFDVRIDRVNKPDKVYIGNYISRRAAIILHWTLTTIGLLLGGYICYFYNITALWSVFVFISATLWFYSTTYKHQFLIGNLLISLLVALVPLFLGFIEIVLINKNYQTILANSNMSINPVAYWVVTFSVFAFFITLIREIIKDMADIDGDNAYYSKTIPIILGVKKTKWLVVFLYLIVLYLLLYLQFKYLKDKISLFYILLMLLPPILYSAFKVLTAKAREDFLIASRWNKIASLIGILFILVFYVMLKFVL